MFKKLGSNYVYIILAPHFFFPLAFFGAGAGEDAVDITLEALEDGAADVDLLAAPDLTLSIALF